MERIFSRLTVYFENPFWVGVYERECGDAYEVCKITFGTDPKDYEVYDFLLKSYPRLLFGLRRPRRRFLKKSGTRNGCREKSAGSFARPGWEQRRSRHCSRPGKK